MKNDCPTTIIRPNRLAETSPKPSHCLQKPARWREPSWPLHRAGLHSGWRPRSALNWWLGSCISSAGLAGNTAYLVEMWNKDRWRTDQVLKSNIINGCNVSNNIMSWVELGDVAPHFQTPASTCVVSTPPCPQAVSSQGQPSESQKALVEIAAGVLADESFSCGHLWPLIFGDLRSLLLLETGKMPSKLSALLIFLLTHTCIIAWSWMFNVCNMPCI